MKVIRTLFSALTLLVVAGTAVAVFAQAPPAGSAQAPALELELEPQADLTPEEQAERRTLFNGLWDYNADESVDAATGRQERAPAGAQRRTGPGQPTTSERSRVGGRGAGGSGELGRGGRGGTGFGGAGVGGAGGFGGSGSDSGLARARAAVASISRGLVRDLMEIPEQLRVSVDDTTISFVDDLERTLTFPTDGSQYEYQVSASKFDARAVWDGVQFRKEIEGARGFRMTETYFLSSDATRLFVIIRLGEFPPPEGVPVNGVNRVYERVTR